MAKITYKLDRIINDNNSLQIGLKTGATISVNSDNKFVLNKDILYSTGLTLSDTLKASNVLITGKYLEDRLTELWNANFALKYTSGTRISFSAKSNNEVTVSLGAATAPTGATTVTADMSNVPTNSKYVVSGSTNQVIDKIYIDDYGAITGISARQLSASELSNDTNTYDNYKQWILTDGTTNYKVTSANYTDDEAGSKTDGKFKLIADSSSPISVSLTHPTGNPITATIGLGLASGGALVVESNKLDLAHTYTAHGTAGMFKITTDTYGRVTSATAITNSDLTGILNEFTSSTSPGTLGLVAAHTAETTAYESTTNTTNSFLSNDGKWRKITTNTVKQDRWTPSDTKYVNLLLTPEISAARKDTDTTSTFTDTVLFNNKLYVENASNKITLYSEYFSGNGSGLTNLDAGNIATGTVSLDRLPQITVAKGGIGNLSFTQGALIYQTTSGGNAFAVISNPTATTGTHYILEKNGGGTTAPTWTDINTIIDTQIAGSNALIFKGVVSSTNPLPTTGFKTGWMYKVGEAGTYAGHVCEVGDTIYAIADYSSSNADGYVYWAAIQTNVDLTNNVTYGTAGTKTLAYINSSTKVAEASTITVSDAGVIQAEASSATKLATARSILGISGFDGTGDVSGTITVSGITASANTANIGSSTTKFANVYATNFVGTASNVANKLTLKLNGSDTGKVEFDGSEAKTFDVSAIVDVNTTNVDTGTGNVLTGISISKDASNKAQLTLSRMNVLASITSDIFNIDTTTVTAPKIGFKTTAGDYFFTGSKPATSTLSNTAYISTNAKLYSSGFLMPVESKASASTTGRGVVTSETGYWHMAPARLNSSSASAEGELLVAEEIDTSTHEYIFNKSGYKVPSSVTWTSTAQIPTAKQVADKIAAVADYADKTIECAYTNSAASYNTNNKTVPTGCVIKEVTIYVTTPYDSTTAVVALKCGSTTIVSTTETDISSTSTAGDMYCFKLNQHVSGDIDIAVTGIASTNKGSVHATVTYVKCSI